jgi:hypothetical protein
MLGTISSDSKQMKKMTGVMNNVYGKSNPNFVFKPTVI